MNKTITRSTVNTEQFSAPEFPKSGFNLGYRDYNDYMLGRWHISGFQFVMPSDKISGHNKGNFTFNNFVTPMVAPTHVGQYNVYCTFRSIDNTFQENVAPSKYNGYSAEWRMPMINTRMIVRHLIDDYFISNGDDYGLGNLMQLLVDASREGNLESLTLDDIRTLEEYTDFSWGRNLLAVYQVLTGDYVTPLHTHLKNMYAYDVLADLREFFESRFGRPVLRSAPIPSLQWPKISGSMLLSSFFYDLLDVIFTPWIGRYSYYADFGYNFLRPSDIYRISHGEISENVSIDDFVDIFDDTPMCEYPLRAMYAFWYDRCRDVNLQPVSSTLPKPRQFGSTSIFDLSAGGNLVYLLYRIRRWTEDMFISAMCDSPARHVYAPVYSNTSINEINGINRDNLYAQSISSDDSHDGRKVFSQQISYLDPLTGSSNILLCPVPSFVNDALSRSSDVLSTTDVYGLTLQNLRQAQNLERYLKRLDYFGDEYNDYMLAQYNSRVSDMRINHPEILSQSIDDANYEQQISSVATSAGTQPGDRTATGTLSSGGDGYTTFCEEFGIIINVISFMPDASYDNATPQLLMSRLVDLPLPIFAANNDELGRIMEIAANGLSPALNGNDADFRFMFGHYPAYHAWRSRVDRVRGSFLNERQDCLFRRFYGMTDEFTTPRLNYEFINCRPNLQMFANTVRYDGQLYGDVVHECYVERVLPTPVEQI